MGLPSSSKNLELVKQYYLNGKSSNDKANQSKSNKNFDKSIFSDKALKDNPDLLKAANEFELNKDDPDASYKFYMEAIKADAKDGAVDGSVFNSGSKKENEKLSRMCLSEILGILSGLDKNDDGIVNGSVFVSNSDKVKDLDLLDDGKANDSIASLIYDLRKGSRKDENNRAYQNNTEDLKDVYNVFDIYNDDSSLKSRFKAIYKTSDTPKSTVSTDAVDKSCIKGGSATGQAIAEAGLNSANSLNSTGWCYKGVANALSTLGIELTGRSAWMAADQLATYKDKFKEMKNLSPEDLKTLPAGAIVVWGQSDRSEHGHISIALGNGQEASDHVQNQMTSLRGYQNFRVFVPSDMA